METIAVDIQNGPDLEKSMSYREYRDLVDGLLAENKTTGDNHSESMIMHTTQNVHRMNRIDRHAKLQPALQEALDNLDRTLLVVALTEGWCGDAAQNLPVFAAIEQASEKVDLRLLLRDENLSFMDEHLTNGGRSIPKVVFYDAVTKEELGEWGPRPAKAQEMFLEYKNNPDESYKQFGERVHLWYGRDRTKSTQAELAELINGFAS